MLLIDRLHTLCDIILCDKKVAKFKRENKRKENIVWSLAEGLGPYLIWMAANS